ncbi:MAG: hypothetical protein WCC94_00520, partial [Candidatus Bathyarchaeia archaeon]
MRQKGDERRKLGLDTIVQGPASEGPLAVAANWATMVCVTVTHCPAGTGALIVRAEGWAVTAKAGETALVAGMGYVTVTVYAGL